MIVLFLLAALEAPAGDLSDPEALLRALAASPKPVQQFISRRANCGHWLGEFADDEDRGAEIRRAAGKLRCDRLDQDEAALRKRYPQPDIQRLLDETVELPGF